MRGSLVNSESAWGVQTLGAKPGPERSFLPRCPQGKDFPARQVSDKAFFIWELERPVAEERREQIWQRTW